MLKSGGFFAEKDIILHIQSPVYLFIYLFTFCNHGCFQTSYKCIKAGGSIQGKCTIFFFFSWVSTPPVLQKEKKASRVSDTAEDFLRGVCMLILCLVLPKYQAILV